METLATVLLGWACCGWVGMFLIRLRNMLDPIKYNATRKLDLDLFIVFTGLGPIALLLVIVELLIGD